MSVGTEKTSTTNSQIRELPKVSPSPEQKESSHNNGGHGGIYSRMREIVAAGGTQEPPPSNLTPIFRSAEFSHPVNDAQKARALQTLQQNYGNRYVQRVLAGEGEVSADHANPVLIQRAESQAGPESEAPNASLGHSSGHALDQPTQDSMGSSFNHDFSGVRVHDDSTAHQAAKGLNAAAFTTGRDVYFSQGAYNPDSASGRKLLAHELTHVVQQSQGATGVSSSGFSVSHPSDPLERQADQVSEAVMRGEMCPPISTRTSPLVHRAATGVQPAATATSTSPRGSRGGTSGGTTPEAQPGDYSFNVAGLAVALPVQKLLARAVPGSKLSVPEDKLKKVALPGFKVNQASLDLDDNKIPKGATIEVGVAISPLDGQGTLNVDKNGNASGTVHVIINSPKRPIPGLKQTELDARITKDDFSFGANVDFDLPKVTGNLQYKYQDHKHSGKGKANYQGSKMRGSIEIIMSEAGLISGSGMLDMELFKGLQGQANVAVDEKRNIAVQGRLSVPGEVVLFPEKKYEKSFFNFEKKFPIWGITVPVIDVNVGIFAEIHAGAGFRSKFGPGVLRGIELTGEFGTDPEAATEFGLGGEFYVPAAAEVVANVGGGIGLGLLIADITGGIEAVGVAGLYTALTVRPQFKYAGGKYTISGMAELGGVAQLKFGINAFAKIDVGVWLFKGTVWRKDWTLAEWVWNTGLNIALRANINYTLGEDFAPDIKFETGDLDPEKFIKDAMPESGSPVPAPPKKAEPEKATLTAEGTQGTQDPSATQEVQGETPKGVTAKTQTGDKGKADEAGGQPDGKDKSDTGDTIPPINIHEGLSLSGEEHMLTAVSDGKELVILMASGAGKRLRDMIMAAIPEIQKSNKPDKGPILAILMQTRDDAKEKELWYAWKGEGKIGTFEQFTARRLSKLAGDLRPLSGHGIKSIDQFFSGVPDFRFLPRQCRTSKWIRPNLFFFGSWKTFRDPIVNDKIKEIKKNVKDARAKRDAGIWDELVHAHLIPEDATLHSSDPTKDTFTEVMVGGSSDYHLDHRNPVAKYWNKEGNKTGDDERNKFAYDKDNLRVVTRAYNLAKGSGDEEGEDRENYDDWVSKSFTSESTSSGDKDSKSINGHSYLDDKDEPIP